MWLKNIGFYHNWIKDKRSQYFEFANFNFYFLYFDKIQEIRFTLKSRNYTAAFQKYYFVKWMNCSYFPTD